MSKIEQKDEVPYSRDQVVLKLKRDAAKAVTTNIPWRPMRYVMESVSEFGASALDMLSKDLGVESIRKIGKPALIFSETEGVAKEEEDQAGLYRTYVMRLSKGMDLGKTIDELKKDQNVEAVDFNYLNFASVVPNDTFYPNQWALPRINCPDAWDKQKGCSKVTVAVVDSGVDLDHPDLAMNLVGGYDLVDAGAADPGWQWQGDISGHDPTPEDDNGHGTHVAGTIAARTNNALGVAGVAWYCKIMPVRVMANYVKVAAGVPGEPSWLQQYPVGTILGAGNTADIAEGIRWAADKGAHVINMSLGGPDSFPKKDAVDYAFGKNSVLVGAMGNANSSVPSYPAAYPNVLAVGATDITDTRANFSNIGPHIDVVAPGVNILSTVPGGGYGTKSGTSMATPHVSGLAALLKCCNMDYSNTQIMDIIRNTARPLGGTSPNDFYGHGIIDAAKAIAECPTIVVQPINLCKLFPWLPWCRGPFDICDLLPWFPGCNVWKPPRIPGSGPIWALGTAQGQSLTSGEDGAVSLDGVERELVRALRVIRKMRSGESNTEGNPAEDCGCPD